jgi:RimJ/RimL family protein N-acetyltransferase
VPDDRAALLGLRDEQFHRFMGPGSPEPEPTFCVCVDDAVIGWVDADGPGAHEWLTDDELNLGYALHPEHRGKGYATRAVMLLLHHLSVAPPASTATLAIDFDNEWSQAIAERCGFTRVDDLPKSTLWKKPVPPLTYTDGVVTIRPHTVDDAEADLAVTDDDQIRWMWLEGWREQWEAKDDAEKLEHKRGNMRDNIAAFATGPKWPFAIVVDGQLVGMVDCDLANPDVPHGEANVSYSIGPEHRGRGHVSRAVRLVLRFLEEHTGAREAHIRVDPANEASLRVLRAVGGPVISLRR